MRERRHIAEYRKAQQEKAKDMYVLIYCLICMTVVFINLGL